MELLSFSLGIAVSMVLSRWMVETYPRLHLKTKRLWIHHWMIGAIICIILLTMGIEPPAIASGLIAGLIIDGLVRKNWRLHQ